MTNTGQRPAGRTTYAQATSEYDADFERLLVDEITTAIAHASMCTDANVMALRTGETASALITCLAGILAVSPAANHSPTAVRKTIEEIAKRLRLRIAKALADPDVQGFARRCFRGTDVAGHG